MEKKSLRPVAITVCCVATIASGSGAVETKANCDLPVSSGYVCPVEVSAGDCVISEGASVTTISSAARFAQLMENWRKKIRYSSSLKRNILQPEYWDIIQMDKAALPFIFREMEGPRWADWLFALRVIADRTVGTSESGINEVRDAWLKWGRDNGYLAA
jgi:hypothetical protein